MRSSTPDAPRAQARPLSTLVVALACIAILSWLPLAPRLWVRGQAALGIVLDVGILLAALVASQWIRGGWNAAPRRFGSVRSWGVGIAWSVLVVYEMCRAGSRTATNEDLPLYDLLLLSKHLYILGRDLYGGWATVGVAAVCVAPIGIAALGAFLAGRVEALARSIGPSQTMVIAAAATVVFLVGSRLPGSRLLTPWLGNNLQESVALYRQVRSDIDTRPHRDIADVTLTRRPDVWIYIVESYGDVVRVDPDLANRWVPSIDTLDAHLTERGWVTASGVSKAPVHGGRSWIADASLLFGLHVDRQSTYEHLIAMADQLDHLPGFFEDQGYDTVLVRPKDRARPGVKLVNYFGFANTVFFEDLEYSGPVIGWGHVPDQYTIGFVHDRVIDELDEPSFAFFHLATAHIPWDEAPPILDPYTAWQGRPGRSVPIYRDRSAKSELRMRMSRFKRRGGNHTRADQGEPLDYVDNVLYDLEAIAVQLEGGPVGDQIVIVMGDHQPPLLANGMPADVPVHVLASDASWLEAFYLQGFEGGLRPRRMGPPQVEHRDLFALLVKSLAEAQPTP